MSVQVTIVGAGLAGCEASLQLAARGFSVRLIEQKPEARTPAQVSDQLCELVCSNSFRGAQLSNAVGLLKEEMRRLGSFTLRAADATRVPAGGALAVDRERFSARMTRWVKEHPRISLETRVVDEVPEQRPAIIATGPLTGDRLAASLARLVGSDALSYYDAIAPIVGADSLNWERVFWASRWDKGDSPDEQRAYVNCPLSEQEYLALVAAIRGARKVEPREFENVRYFEGCLPIDVMAERGDKTLAFGPLKPIGLVDPRTRRRPYAVVQLRKEDEAGSAFNMVGFQTRMAWGEQPRVFALIPGLEHAEFLRFGAVHRNTFLDAPRLLDATLGLAAVPGLYFAGQITGTEGYVESAAGGWLAAYFVARRLEGKPAVPPPPTTAHGGLLTHLSRKVESFQPSNITFAHLPPWHGDRLGKRAKNEAIAERALTDLERWVREQGSVAA